MRPRSSTPDLRAWYSVRNGFVRKKTGLPAASQDWDTIREIVEGGTDQQRHLLRGNYKKFKTRPEAVQWSDTPVASVFPKKWAEVTPCIKLLGIITCCLVFLYIVRDLLGVVELQLDCARQQMSYVCDKIIDSKKYVKDQQHTIGKGIEVAVAVWFGKLTEFIMNRIFG